MIGDAKFPVWCDQCHGEELYNGTALAGGAYDSRDLERQLEGDGWRIDGDQTFCPQCVEDEEAERKA